MKLKLKKIKSLALEGEKISQENFKKEIIKAEKGPFYSTEEAKKLVAERRKKKSPGKNISCLSSRSGRNL